MSSDQGRRLEKLDWMVSDMRVMNERRAGVGPTTPLMVCWESEVLVWGLEIGRTGGDEPVLAMVAGGGGIGNAKRESRGVLLGDFDFIRGKLGIWLICVLLNTVD